MAFAIMMLLVVSRFNMPVYCLTIISISLNTKDYDTNSVH